MNHNANIKILIEFHLERLGDNWDSFLVRNHLRRRIKSHLVATKQKEEGREYLTILLKTYLNNNYKNS